MKLITLLLLISERQAHSFAESVFNLFTSENNKQVESKATLLQHLTDFYDLIFQTDAYKAKQYDKWMLELKEKNLGPFHEDTLFDFNQTEEDDSWKMLDIGEQRRRMEQFYESLQKHSGFCGESHYKE
jgi:hypothetical protein